jgi:hypothetical protein
VAGTPANVTERVASTPVAAKPVLWTATIVAPAAGPAAGVRLETIGELVAS